MESSSAAAGAVNTRTMQLIKTDRSKQPLIDEESMMKQIEATHDPAQGPGFNVRDLLSFTQTILSFADETVKTGRDHPSLDEKSRKINHIPSLQALRNVADLISMKIRHGEQHVGNMEETTRELFKMLKSYTWEAKLVAAVAALALNYAESCLLAQAYSSNPLPTSMEVLWKLRRPFILDFTEASKAQFDNLVKAMLDVGNCVVDFKELPSVYISTAEVPAFTEAIASIPIAAYHIISTIVACASWIKNLSDQPAAATPWDLEKLQNTYNLLKAKLDKCLTHIEDKKNEAAYITLLNLYDEDHIDDMKILNALINSKNEVSPLVRCDTKEKASLDLLRRKNVLLLISGTHDNCMELDVFLEFYGLSRMQATGREESQFEVVWIPIVGTTRQFAMPWYSVHHSNLVPGAVIRFIKEVWHFKDKPILVALDPQGNVVNPNAFHMIFTWGIHAFPFSTSREESLWMPESWGLHILIAWIDETVLDWIAEGKHILLYGGDNIDWIRQFTSKARAVAQAANIPLEMAYVGKGTKMSSKIHQVVEMIAAENLSYALPELMMAFFWSRLQSMLSSKIHLHKTDEHDPIMRETKRLLSYDRQGQWAILSKGPEIVVTGHSTTLMPALEKHDEWINQVPIKGFDKAFKEYHDKLSLNYSHRCCHFDFPANHGSMPERFTCPHCSRAMEKYVAFSCCDDDAINGII